MNSYRVYCLLLALYPTRFKLQFGPAMAQVFNDCCREEPNILALWLRTLQDLIVSLVREWRHDMDLRGSQTDYSGRADRFTIFLVVGTLLWVWGSAAFLVLNLQPLFNYIFASIVTSALAILIGVVCVNIVARHGRMERQPIIKV